MVERLAILLLGKGAEASENSRVKARARQAEAERRSSRTKTAALMRSARKGGRNKREQGMHDKRQLLAIAVCAALSRSTLYLR